MHVEQDFLVNQRRLKGSFSAADKNLWLLKDPQRNYSKYLHIAFSVAFYFRLNAASDFGLIKCISEKS